MAAGLESLGWLLGEVGWLEMCEFCTICPNQGNSCANLVPSTRMSLSVPLSRSLSFLFLCLCLCLCLFSVSRFLLYSFSLPLVLPISLFQFFMFSVSNSFPLSCCLSLFLFEIAYSFHYIMLSSIPRCSIIFSYVVLFVVRFARALLCFLLCSCIVLSLPFYDIVLYVIP